MIEDTTTQIFSALPCRALPGLAEGSDDELLQGRLPCKLGRMEALNGGEVLARTRLQAALGLAIRLRNALLECETRNELGAVYARQNRFDAAGHCLDRAEAARIGADLELQRGVALCHAPVGHVDLDLSCALAIARGSCCIPNLRAQTRFQPRCQGRDRVQWLQLRPRLAQLRPGTFPRVDDGL